MRSPIRILDRFVAGTFFKLFVVFLVASPPLFILGDLTEHLDNYIDRGLTGWQVAKGYMFELPQFIQWSFPVAGLIAIVFTVFNMTTHREIVAAKAGGISFHRLLLPAFVVGVLLTGAAVGLMDAVPLANRVAGKILQNQDTGRRWRSDFVYVSDTGLSLQVAQLQAADNRMSGIVIEEPHTATGPAVSITAQRANWDPTAGWTLKDGYVRLLFADSTEQTLEFDSLSMTALVEKPEELLESPRKPEEMTYAEISHLAHVLARTGGNAQRLLVQQKQMLAIPVATLVVMLFGAPLATSTRRGGTAYGIGISLGTTILYMLLFKIAGALGMGGSISPWTAAWVPNLLFLVTGGVLMLRVRT
jgi:lipopolysaccharide export system permease protein